MFGLGVPELFIILLIFGLPLLLLGLVLRRAARESRQDGYPTLTAFLGATPRTDAERRGAADLLMMGLGLGLIGVFFKPLLLAAAFAVYFGGRKVLYSLMGLAPELEPRLDGRDVE